MNPPWQSLLWQPCCCWEDVVKNKGGWNTLIWYGGIIGLSSLLSKVKFFEWLAEVFKNNLAFDGHGNVAFFVIIFLSTLSRKYIPIFPDLISLLS